MPDVYELTGAYNNIVQGNPLVFPNVDTCMAFIASDGISLIGVHFTQLDQSGARINGAWGRVQALSAGAHDVYVAGPSWNASLLLELVPPPASIRSAMTPAVVDIRATLAGGIVTVEHSPAGSGGPWAALLMA
jgi:hypothetical protein